LCRAYIEFVRGIPALALLFLIYFGLVPLGIVVDSFTAAVIGLGMNQGAYLAEVLRGGIEALHKGQREAALAVGMTPIKAYRHIIMPQAVRIVLPPLLNMLIILLKDSSIKDLASMSFLPMHLYLLAGLIYFLMACPLSLMTRRVEKRLRRGMRKITA
jgi:polar amino acid transport system permease protein